MSKVGDTIVHKGQPYRAVETFDHERRDGSTTVLMRWTSNCATCGDPFEFTTPASSKKFEPNRRCQVHKRPGQRVPSKANVIDLAEHRDRWLWGDTPKGGAA